MACSWCLLYGIYCSVTKYGLQVFLHYVSQKSLHVRSFQSVLVPVPTHFMRVSLGQALRSDFKAMESVNC